MFKTKESIICSSLGPCASGVNYVVPTIFSELLVDIDDEGTITRCSDVNFLFHQMHLDKLNPTSLQYYIDKLRQPSGPDYFAICTHLLNLFVKLTFIFFCLVSFSHTIVKIAFHIGKSIAIT